MSQDPVILPPLVERPGLIDRLFGLRRQMSWKQAFAALKHPNYRLWFWGQMFSMFGARSRSDSRHSALRIVGELSLNSRPER